MFKLIIFAIISNAIKYTFKGKIKIENVIDNTLKKQKIIISDTGIGISKERMSSLFKV